jgi:hypothetical protein
MIRDDLTAQTIDNTPRLSLVCEADLEFALLSGSEVRGGKFLSGANNFCVGTCRGFGKTEMSCTCSWWGIQL